MSCSTSRTATNSNEELRTTELRSTETRDSVTIELRDTLKEVTTITIDRNDAGDTVRWVQITDRYRRRDASQLTDKSEKIIVETDTVYIAVRDSVVETQNNGATEVRKSSFVSSLKWIFWIILALTVLLVVVRLRR